MLYFVQTKSSTRKIKGFFKPFNHLKELPEVKIIKLKFRQEKKINKRLLAYGDYFI